MLTILVTFTSVLCVLAWSVFLFGVFVFAAAFTVEMGRWSGRILRGAIGRWWGGAPKQDDSQFYRDFGIRP